MSLRQVNRLRERLVQVSNGVIQQLDNIFAAVGIRTRVLERGLVIVRGFCQSGCPGVELVRELRLLWVRLAVVVRVNEEYG